MIDEALQQSLQTIVNERARQSAAECNDHLYKVIGSHLNTVRLPALEGRRNITVGDVRDVLSNMMFARFKDEGARRLAREIEEFVASKATPAPEPTDGGGA